MSKLWKRVGITLAGAVVVGLITLGALFWNEIRSLASIRQVDEYGMSQMTYYGDYGFDDFLQTGAEDDGDIEEFVTKRLLKGLPIDLDVPGVGCTVFVTRNEEGEIIMGRNFDFSYAPSMQVWTRPESGYASVSTVNLSFAGYSKDNLPSGLNFDSFLALAAPFLPFDGMNEKGLAVALLAVPEAEPPVDESKVTLNTTTIIRLILDKAATVEEAVDLMRGYNIYFSADIYCHYIIADASGKSVLVEYFDGGLQVVPTEQSYQIASNFIAYNGVNIGEGFSEFERYDAVEAAIQNNGERLSEAQAVDLLAEVGAYYEGEDRLQWSVLYNLSNLDGTIFAHRNTDNTINFQLY